MRRNISRELTGKVARTSTIFRSIVETSKRGHRIENKDGGQKQLSNVEFSK